MADSIIDALCEQVRAASAARTPLRIHGGGSKSFYGREGEPGTALDVRPLSGIVNYEPTELVLTARAGTTLVEIEAALAERGQMLAFEPPHYAGGATLGGAIACGLSGPRRFSAGAARDFVLGTRVINGRGEHLRFGGEVMKNVAGFDVSRVLCGALGTLGVLTEVSLKVLPAPALERSLSLELPHGTLAEQVDAWSAQGLPITASAHDGRRGYLRLSGPEGTVAAACAEIGGEALADAGFWQQLRDHSLSFFQAGASLWRIALPAHAPELDLDGPVYREWNGQLRWLASTQSASEIRAAVTALGGHATLFRGGERSGAVFTPLAHGLRRLHENLKRAFDPAGIFNPGRLYAEF